MTDWWFKTTYCLSTCNCFCSRDTRDRGDVGITPSSDCPLRIVKVVGQPLDFLVKPPAMILFEVLACFADPCCFGIKDEPRGINSGRPSNALIPLGPREVVLHRSIGSNTSTSLSKESPSVSTLCHRPGSYVLPLTKGEKNCHSSHPLLSDVSTALEKWIKQ